jgi:hypothetical protein
MTLDLLDLIRREDPEELVLNVVVLLLDGQERGLVDPGDFPGKGRGRLGLLATT